MKGVQNKSKGVQNKSKGVQLLIGVCILYHYDLF